MRPTNYVIFETSITFTGLSGRIILYKNVVVKVANANLLHNLHICNNSSYISRRFFKYFKAVKLAIFGSSKVFCGPCFWDRQVFLAFASSEGYYILSI